jgi:glycosyltransferase involved in cell wall biosynthesis
MYDIIFDFTASPGGGGKKRAEAYATEMESRGLNTLFLLNSRLPPLRRKLKNVEIEYVTKGSVERFLNDQKRVRQLSGNARWYFAYGIPVYRRIGERNWFHLSNVLPFARGRYSASISLKLKMGLLGWRVRMGSGNIDQFSAESVFGTRRFRDFTGVKMEGVLLRNGIDESADDPLNRSEAHTPGYAIAIGTYSYKRLDRVLDVFMNMERSMDLRTLKIVGNIGGVPRSMRRNPRVELMGTIELQQVYRLLGTAKLFISASEIENSSNAVLEALSRDTKTVLSCIPSHAEMVDRQGSESLVLNGMEYVVVEKRNLVPEYRTTWSQVVDTMLTAMGFKV